MNFSDFKLENYKKSIVFSTFFIIVIIVFYFFVFDKILHILELEEMLERKRICILKVKQEKKRVYERSKFLKKRLENIKDEAEKNSLKNNYSFKNINSVEIFIENYINKNLLHLLTIGRYEKDELSKTVYIPYIIQGNLKNLIFFIKELEASKMDISFGETSFLLKIDKLSTFEGKIKTMFNEVDGVDSKNYFINLENKLKKKRIEKIKILNFNGKNYLILRYNNEISDILTEKHNMIIQGEKYRIKIKENKIYLQ